MQSISRQAPAYSRSSPSPHYLRLVSEYRRMHTEVEQFAQIPAEQTFKGQSLPRHGATIKTLVEKYRARTLLDYGSGKGWQYTAVQVTLPDGTSYASIPAYWGVESVTCYDPGYEPFSRIPTGTFDGVVSTDVLEHCPEDDIDWILGEMFGYAERFVFANVACYPAQKRLSSGENAHCTVRPKSWWLAALGRASARRPQVRYLFLLDSVKQSPDGANQLETEMLSG